MTLFKYNSTRLFGRLTTEYLHSVDKELLTYYQYTSAM